MLVFGSPKQRQRPEHLEPERARDLAKKALADWARACHQRGLLLCLEPLTSAETDFIVSAGEAVQLIEEIDEPGLALHLDVRAMLSEELPMEEIIRSYAKYLRHVHVNDAGMIPPGKGETPYEPIVSALKESGYTGYLSVEVFDLQGQEPQVVARESANLCGLLRNYQRPPGEYHLPEGTDLDDVSRIHTYHVAHVMGVLHNLQPLVGELRGIYLGSSTQRLGRHH